MMLPRCISLNSLNFDFNECSFTDKLMKCKDKKDGLSREGSGRVSIMNATQLPNCYTLECNYASGKRINHLFPKTKENGEIEMEFTFVTDSKAQYYQEYKDANQSPPYNIAVFEDVGRAFLLGVLDYYSLNPVSRLPISPFKDIDGLKKDVLSKNPIFLPKKELEGLYKKPPMSRIRSLSSHNSLCP